MPISEQGEPIGGQPYTVNVPMPEGSGLFVSITIQSDGSATEQALEGALQDIIDLFQEWEGKHPLADVTGLKYSMFSYAATPTDPLPPPPPPGP